MHHRRSFLAHMSLLPLLGFAGACAPSAGPPEGAKPFRMPPVIDMSRHATPILQRLRRHGVDTVMRYYSRPRSDGTLPEQILLPEEKRAILDSGLSLGIVFQFYNHIPTNITKKRARLDAETCFALIDRNEQPEGSAIYFGIDFDWYEGHANRTDSDIEGYFETLNEAFTKTGRTYKIGVYGNGHTCRLLKEAGLASLFWLPRSRAFGGTRDFYNSGDWSMYQNKTDIFIEKDIPIDTDLRNPQRPDTGAFDGAGPATAPRGDRAVLAARRFVSADLLTIHEKPDPSSGKVAELRRGQNLAILSEKGEWAHVDVNEGLGPSGHCQTSGLVGMDRFPT